MSKFLFAIALLSCLNLTLAQRINFEFDYAQFGYDSLSNYVEFYYSFNQNNLRYVHTDSSDNVEGVLHIEIDDSVSGEIIVDKNWLVSNVVTDSLNLNRSLIGIVGFVLNAGSYIVNVTGSDALKSPNSKTITEYLHVNPFLKISSALSDIQLASNVIPGSENTSSIFYKNTYEVTPLPAPICGENQPMLFYYTELYNLKDERFGSDLRIDELIVNSRGQIVSMKTKRLNKSVNSRVEVGIVKAHKLPTDTYTLKIILIDSVANHGVSSTKRFFVYNPSIVEADSFQQTISPVLSTAFGAMSEEELDDLFAKSKYIATTSEQDRFKALTTVQGKREFMYNFWKVRDENNADDRNEYYMKYLERIDDTNAKFSAMGKDGWRTDRGRVYLIYGEPSEIERYPNQTETRPYEIWHYESLEGGVEFIFGDITGFSDYQLLHSTKRGELRDEYWLRRIAIY